MAQGVPFSRVRWRGFTDNEEMRNAERVHVQIPLPEAAELYFEGCGKIDHHNRTRHHCGIDKKFRTNNWAT